MLFAAPAVKVVGPAAVMGPLWVIAPVLVRARVPVQVVPALALSPVPIVSGPVVVQARLPPCRFTSWNVLAALGRLTLPRLPAVPPKSVTVKVWPTLKVTGALCVRL